MNYLIHEPKCRNCQDKKCCYFGVNLTKEEFFSGFYKTKYSGLWEGDQLIGIVLTLERKKDGSCIYLTEDKLCSIYGKRPKYCKDYFCEEFN